MVMLSIPPVLLLLVGSCSIVASAFASEFSVLSSKNKRATTGASLPFNTWKGFAQYRVPIPRNGVTSTSTSSSSQLHMMPQLGWLCGAIRGGAVEVLTDSELAVSAFGWNANLCAPAALVSGAVLATLSQTRGELATRKTDRYWVRFAKRACTTLLLSSFAMEIFCIFVSTVTGTMLLSHGDIPAGVHAGVHYHSPMGFLNYNHEFEYLTSRVTFLQGLFNWLLAVALETIIPRENEGEGSRKMNRFISAGLTSMALLLLKFYNDHTTFYNHYGEMLWRYLTLTWKRFFWTTPVRPLQCISLPLMIFTLFLGWQAVTAPRNEDDD